jgi:hypothetical protein
MKAVFYYLIIFSGLCVHAQEEFKEEEYHHCLLGESSLIIGLGVPYSFELKTAGINSRFYYGTGENLCFGPELSYFKKDEVEILDIDFVIHYIIETPWLGIYPVVGINYTKEHEEGHSDKNEYGFLWGIGMHRNLKKIIVFTEYTRIESALHDQFITAGLMYHFKLK